MTQDKQETKKNVKDTELKNVPQGINQEQKESPEKGNTEAVDPNKIQVIPDQLGNTSVLTVQLLNSINQNLMALIAYMKHKDIESKK